jgi:RNA polymerase sigma factor (sigma-70 family)
LLHDPDAAQDIVHDVFVTFAENAGRIHITTSLKHYLTTCVVNRVRDEYRRRTKKQALALDEIEPPVADSSGPETTMADLEKTKLLTSALTQVPFEQREAIVLHLSAGLKFGRIAKLQHTSVSTVHARYKYGLKKLYSILNGEFHK